MNKDFFDEEGRKSDIATASDRTYHAEEILISPSPTARFQPEKGVNSLLTTLDSLARGLDNTNQLLHQERAYSKALLKENYDLKLKIKEFESKNSDLLDDLLIRNVGRAEGDSHGESQNQHGGYDDVWQTVRPRRNKINSQTPNISIPTTNERGRQGAPQPLRPEQWEHLLTMLSPLKLRMNLTKRSRVSSEI